MLNLRMARAACLLLLSCLFVGCASTQSTDPRDPWEGFNRSVFKFNDAAETWVLKPVAKGYTAVTPDPVERGISNFFDNLLELRNVFNDILQWKWGQAGNDFGRFLVNTTLGVAGFFDVATHLDLPKSDGEDFGQTLAAWGVGPGPYLVLPFLGPSTVRDTVSLPVDWSADPVSYIDHVPTRNSVRALDFIDRSTLLLDVGGLVSGDKYIFYREGYLQNRNFLINDGEVEDSFDDFGGDFGEDDF